MRSERGLPGLAILSFAAVALTAASCSRESRLSGDRMVSVGSHRLEMSVMGGGSPAVVIDSGIGDTFDKLKPLQERLSRATRVVTYNRAGYGRSEPGPLPRDAGREAEELKALLEKASVAGPCVLVGHSLGALNVQVFASRYPGKVAGLVLLDPPPLSFILGREYADLGEMAERMTGEWQAGADSAAKSADAGERARAAFLRMIASEHREMFGETARIVDAIPSFGDIPLTVIAAGKPNPAFGASAEEYQKYWVEQSRRLSGKSNNGKFILAEDSGHHLYLDVPNLVEKVVLSLVSEVRAKAPGAIDAAAVVARCAEAMGGAKAIAGLRDLRAEVVYPDHGDEPVLQEIRRPNMIRTERPGKYILVFDGRRGAMLKFDPAKSGQPPILQALPPEADRGFETDLVWFFPAFFDYPAEYGGTVESNGAECHKLTVTLPLGTRAEYLVDARTFLVRTIAVDEIFQGKTFHMEREWLDLSPVQGILYPGRMTYPGRDGKQAAAEIKKVEFNPVLGEDRFQVPVADK